MHVLLCAATAFEIAPLQQLVQQQRAHKVQFLITGIGAMAATYHITKAVVAQKPDLLLQAGVAGAFTEALPLGTTVAVECETMGDLGVLEEARFHSVFSMGLEDKDAFPWTNGSLINTNGPLLHIAALPLIKSITVNEITTSKSRIDYYKNDMGAGIESMEGAALHFVGLQEAVPFLQIRSVSNYVGERNKKNWALHEAVQNLNNTLETLLKKLSCI